MRRSILLLCAALALVSSCATVPVMPTRSTGADSVNWHADSLAWSGDVKRAKADDATRLRLVMVMLTLCLILPGGIFAVK